MSRPSSLNSRLLISRRFVHPPDVRLTSTVGGVIQSWALAHSSTKGRKMKRQKFLCLTIILLCVTSGAAQSSGKQPSSTPNSATVTDIRKVDFRDFTYPSSLCSQEYGKKGIGKMVRVRNGEFKNKNVYFAVADNKIVYADVTGDGHEDAIVPIECGATTANFARSEVYIYTIQDGRLTLLAQASDKEMERDYRGSYPDAESYWGINENGLKVNNGNLAIDVLADGPHASPKYIVTLEYRLSAGTLRLVGKPQRRNSSQ